MRAPGPRHSGNHHGRAYGSDRAYGPSRTYGSACTYGPSDAYGPAHTYRSTCTYGPARAYGPGGALSICFDRSRSNAFCLRCPERVSFPIDLYRSKRFSGADGYPATRRRQ